MQPSERPQVYDTYWRFAAERQAAFFRKQAGQPAPWTDDPILRRFKFCNTYRASDRVSQYLIREVIYSSRHVNASPEDVFLRIILFRLFSKESTWQELERVTGGVTRKSLDVPHIAAQLDAIRMRRPIYTAAFILCAHDAYGYSSKHRNHLALVEDMFRPGRLGRALGMAKSLADVYAALLQWPMIGPFMAYQIAIDLNYSSLLNFSEDEFTMPGPGALRGLKKVFVDFGSYTPSELVSRMVDRQEEEFARLGIHFDNLFGRRLHAIDCQGLFCETDKYSRQAYPELASNRVRIKQEYRPLTGPLELFYPPKWGLNVRTPAAAESDEFLGSGQLSLC